MVVLSLFFSSVALGFSDQEITDQKIADVANSSQWFKLLHYHKHLLHGPRSQQDAQSFFLSKNGKNSPVEELKASIEAFQNAKAQCDFPARYRFVKKKFALKTKDADCPELSAWFKQLDAESLTLISANSYPQNPISTFGHTFLRINSSQSSKLQYDANSKKVDLLNYSIGFAANAPEKVSSLDYVFSGVFGGFDGHFSLLPYYLKTKEYNNLESRDIWEYDLNFTKEETQIVLLHLWELLRNSRFDYFFFDENCSYQILTLLDVARDDLHLTADFSVYTPPMETVKVIVNKYHLVTKIKYRASLYDKAKKAAARLTDLEKEELSRISKSKTNIANSQSAAVLDALIANYSYLKQKGSRHYTEEDDEKYYTALRRRSQLDAKPFIEEEMSDKNSPHHGHDTSLLNVSAGMLGGRVYNELKYSAAYHDYLTNEVGYPAFSKFDILSVKVRNTYSRGEEKNLFQVHEVTPLAITSFLPMNEIDRSISWSGEVKYARALENAYLSEYKAGALVGLSKLLGGTLVYSLLGPEFRFLVPEKIFSSDLSLRLGLLSAVSEKFKIGFSTSLNYFLFNRDVRFFYSPSLNLSWNFHKNYNFRISSSYVNRDFFFKRALDSKVELVLFY